MGGKANKELKKMTPNMPKRPLAGYFLFTKSARARITAANPGFAITKIAKLMGDEWKKLSDAEKAPFQEEAKALKAQYAIDLAEYKQTSEYKKFLVAKAEAEKKSSPKKKPKKSPKKKAKKPKAAK